MAVNPISTYAIVQSTLSDVNNVEGNLQREQEQVSSGNASQDFAGLGGQVQQFLSIDSVLSHTNQYLNDNKIVETRVATTSSVLGQVITTASSLQNLISSRLSGVANSSAFGSQLQGIFQQLAGQLNTAIGNQYLFSGSQINSPAVDAKNFPTLQQVGAADASYYLGNSQGLTTRPQDNSVITYNVCGNAQGFQDIIAGLATAKAGDDANDSTLLQQAENLVQKGMQLVTNYKATVDANAVQLSTDDTNLTNSKLYLQGIQQSIGNTDLVSVSTQIATNQGILQAAFQVYSKISSLRLSDYLK